MDHESGAEAGDFSYRRLRSAGPSPSPTSESETSSVTLDNDPDNQYYIDDDGEIVDLTGSTSRDFTPSSVSGPLPSYLTSPGAQRDTPERHTPRDIIDLTGFEEGDYLTDERIAELLRRLNQASQPRPSVSHRQIEEPTLREIITEACVDGILYKAGQSVELHNGLFLRITSVLQAPDGAIFLEGRRLIRMKHVKTTVQGRELLNMKPRENVYVPMWPNEVLWVANGPSEIPLALVKRFCVIRFTNWCHRDTDQRSLVSRNELFCRLKQTSGSSDEASLQYLSYEDADDKYRFSPRLLREMWRGETRSFGEAESPPTPSRTIVDVDTTSAAVIDLTGSNLHTRRQYTFGDGFCGAGGVSCGAVQAGLHIKWAFDKSEAAMDTYRCNFEPDFSETSEVFTFLSSEPEDLRVDVSHGSPPCQTFSQAHTINGPNDDDNSSCIFSCGDLIKKAKPRVHTMEETSGLFERHNEVFARVVQDFVEIGYSVRWGILNCLHYGVPQTRKRLIVIASGPGETLPKFPKRTHGIPGSGLLRYATINDKISDIPAEATQHNVAGALARGPQRPPYDPHQPAKTLTCAGGEKNYHPSGHRTFTNREFACLQTFPIRHQFGGREVRKQIGNAVPPVLAKAVFREIIKSLRKTDEAELEHVPRTP